MIRSRLLATALLATSLFATQSGFAARPLNSIVAVVNDDVIVESELQVGIEAVRKDLLNRGLPLPSADLLEAQVLEELISQRLQSQRAEDLGIEVDEATLTAALENIASRNGLTLADLRGALNAQGVDFDQFREDTRRQILNSRLQQQEVLRDIQVSDAEVDRYVQRSAETLVQREGVRLQHLLVAVPEGADSVNREKARERISALRERLLSGEDFKTLAMAESDGSRAAEGGELGWFAIDEVPSLAKNAANRLGAGQVSKPIESPSGYHLIRVAEIEYNLPAPVSETRARHILIRTNEMISAEDAKRRLAQLRLRIQGGDDFATLAQANSDDTGSALKGGELGWIGPGDTVQPFEEAMNQLAPGAISQPFESPFGWHIVQVQERRTQGTREELLRLQAQQLLREQKAEAAREDWLQRLRDEAYIDLRLDQRDL